MSLKGERKNKGYQRNAALESLHSLFENLMEQASERCKAHDWEGALYLYQEGLKLKPFNMQCRMNVKRITYKIENITKTNLLNNCNRFDQYCASLEATDLSRGEKVLKDKIPKEDKPNLKENSSKVNYQKLQKFSREGKSLHEEFENLMELASQKYQDHDWEGALYLYQQGLKLKPFNMQCRLNVKRISYKIENRTNTSLSHNRERSEQSYVTPRQKDTSKGIESKYYGKPIEDKSTSNRKAPIVNSSPEIYIGDDNKESFEKFMREAWKKCSNYDWEGAMFLSQKALELSPFSIQCLTFISWMSYILELRSPSNIKSFKHYIEATLKKSLKVNEESRRDRIYVEDMDRCFDSHSLERVSSMQTRGFKEVEEDNDVAERETTRESYLEALWRKNSKVSLLQKTSGTGLRKPNIPTIIRNGMPVLRRPKVHQLPCNYSVD